LERWALTLLEQEEALRGASIRLEPAWQSDGAAGFLGDFRGLLSRYRTQAEELQALALRLRKEVEEWELAAQPGARTILGPGGIYISSEKLTAIAHAVLASSAVAISDVEIGSTWNERFALRRALPGQIADLENRINQTRETVGNIDQEIADLKAKQDDLRKEANKRRNQFIPAWPPAIDLEDGVPWRVKADDYEDEIANLDRRIAELEAQRNNHMEELRSMERQLGKMRAQQKALDAAFQRGIPPDGPTPSWLSNHLFGCTHYVAERRNITALYSREVNNSEEIRKLKEKLRADPKQNQEAWRHASSWDERARAAGYEVGKEPVKGAIVVFEGHAHYKDEGHSTETSMHPLGHVAYVEEVDYSNPDVVRIKITDAGIINGQETPPKTHWVTLRKDEIDAGEVNFIYDKLAAPTSPGGPRTNYFA